MKEPHLLTLQTVFDTLMRESILPETHYFKDGFGVVIGMGHFLQPFIQEGNVPFLLDDYRMGYVRRGSMRSVINLQEQTITAGHALFVCPGSIVEPLAVSDDFAISGMGIQPDVFQIAFSGAPPSLFNGKQKHGVLSVTVTEGTLIELLLRTLQTMAAGYDGGTDQSVNYHLIAAIASYYDRMFARRDENTVEDGGHTALFDHFIRLVNEHCAGHRRLAFYADKLCVSERHLCTLVRKASGRTPKEWIDKAVVTSAKVKLRHSGKQIREISDELHFPSSAFFCKYFKRMTGCTPQEFRDPSRKNEDCPVL